MHVAQLHSQIQEKHHPIHAFATFAQACTRGAHHQVWQNGDAT